MVTLRGSKSKTSAWNDNPRGRGAAGEGVCSVLSLCFLSPHAASSCWVCAVTLVIYIQAILLATQRSGFSAPTIWWRAQDIICYILQEGQFWGRSITEMETVAFWISRVNPFVYTYIVSTPVLRARHFIGNTLHSCWKALKIKLNGLFLWGSKLHLLAAETGV